MSVPLGFPVHQFFADLHFLGIDVRFGSLVEVFHEDVVAVGPHLGSKIIDGDIGDSTQLRMRRSSPRSVGAGIGRDTCGLAVAIGDSVEAVGQLAQCNGAAGNPAGPPVVTVPGGDVALGIGSDRHLDEPTGPRPADFQFGGTIEHQADWFAGFSGEFGTSDPPLVGSKFRPEPATDVVAGDRDIAGIQSQRSGELPACAGDVLRREVHIEFVFAVPLAV